MTAETWLDFTAYDKSNKPSDKQRNSLVPENPYLPHASITKLTQGVRLIGRARLSFLLEKQPRVPYILCMYQAGVGAVGRGLGLLGVELGLGSNWVWGRVGSGPECKIELDRCLARVLLQGRPAAISNY